MLMKFAIDKTLSPYFDGIILGHIEVWVNYTLRSRPTNKCRAYEICSAHV